MKTPITIWMIVLAAVILAWTGMAGAQATPATPKMQLPSGETVWDVNGDWDVFVENYGEQGRFGIYPQVFRIIQTDNTFTAIRLKNNPPPVAATTSRAGCLP